MTTQRLWLIAAILLSCATHSARAQDPPTPEVAGPGQEQPAEDQALREKTIYIPYNKLRGIFEKEGRGVFLPYEEFQELWRKALAATPPVSDPKPPVDALITEINSEAVVEQDVVRVTATLKIEVLREGWHETPLRLADAAILSARLNGEPARVVPGEGYRLLLEKAGQGPAQYELVLEYAKAFDKAPGQNSVSFQAPQAPVNRWRIRVPQEGVKVNVHPRVAATEAQGDQPADSADAGSEDPPPPANNKETVVLAFVGAASEVRIDWTPRSEGASGLAALTNVQARQQVLIDEGVVRTQTRLDYDISRAELTQLVIQAPADHKVVNVYDPNVRGWEIAAEGDLQTITVDLFEPTRGSQSLVVELEKFSEEASRELIAAPVVRGMNVARQYGLVVVRLSPALRGEAVRRTGLMQLDAADLPAELAGEAWDYSYRYASLPFDLALEVDKVEPRVQARQLAEAYLQPDLLTLELTAVYEIERAGVFQLDLEIPAGFDVRQVRGQATGDAEAAAYDSHHLVGDAGDRLQVNLSRKALGRVGLWVQLQRRLSEPNLLSPTGQASEIAVPLPRVAPASVERLSGNLIVYAPESLRVRSAAAEGLQPVSFPDAVQPVASARGDRFQGAREILAYAHSDQPVDLALSVQRRKPQVTARHLLVAGIESGVVRYQAEFFYEILYSGVNSLRIDVPAELVGRLNLDTKSVQYAEIEPQPDDVAEGEVAWSLTGETEFLGEPSFVFRWEEKIDELDVGKSLDLVLPRFRPRNVDRAWGQIVVRKAENVDVRESGEPSGLRPIDPQTDLMPGAAVQDAARAFEFHDDWSLQVTATRYELEEVKRTSIERAVLRMVVGRDRKTSVQALYRMRTARQRLEVQLPASFDPTRGFNLNPLRINGQATELERGEQGEYYVPLVNQNPQTPFVLELRYTVDSGQENLEFPVFPTDPAIQKVYLATYLPEEQALLGARGPWTSESAVLWREAWRGRPTAPVEDNELVRWVTEGVDLNVDPTSDFQVQGKLHTFSTLRPQPPPQGALSLTTFHQDGLHALIFLFIAAPGVVLVVRPWGERLLAVGLLLVGLLLAGVFFPHFAAQVIDEVLGLAVLLVLGVWLLMAAFAFSRRRVAALAAAGATVPASPETRVSSESSGESSQEPAAQEADSNEPRNDDAARQGGSDHEG